MVLDRIRVKLADERAEICDQLRLLLGSRGLQNAFKAPIIAHGYQEDAAS